MAVKVEPIGVEEIRTRLARFEARFDMPSERFVQAFQNGELEETAEFEEWSMLQSALELATRQR